MTDRVAKIEGSLVHHGDGSDRAYLMKLGGDPAEAAAGLERLARRQGYSKIIAKVPARARVAFAVAGYRAEGAVPRYFRGCEAAFFMAKYLTPSRRRPADPKKVSEVLAASRRRREMSPASPSPPPACRRALSEDTVAMAGVYRRVFASYPFPIHDPAYLRKTMEENVVYFGIWEKDAPVALASAEIDPDARSAEMTDFATLPEWRGNGLATILLVEMEREMRHRGITTVYTIARAVSFSMNMAFAKLGYRYGGTLTRNTQIAGSLECMNIWFKGLK